MSDPHSAHFPVSLELAVAVRPARRHRTVFALQAALLGLIGMTSASAGEPICRPALAFQQVLFSEMLPPTFERKWLAVVSVNASRCKTTAGYFEVVFSRAKEIGPELEFREQFIWNEPSVMVGADLWADESIERYSFGEVQTCPCRD